MLKSMKIQNYRGFGCLEMNNLGAVNIVVGKNNSGKTSLMEAIFLLAGGSAQFIASPGILRLPDLNFPLGATESVATAVASQVSVPFLAQLFHNQDMADPIKIEANLEERGSATLKISIEQKPEIQISLEMKEPSTKNFLRNHSIKVELSRPGKKSIDASDLLLAENGNLSVESPDRIDPLFPSVIKLSKTNGNDPKYAQRMGDARRVKKGDRVLNALKIIEPRLQSVEDNSFAGSPIILCDIGQPELVPLSVMGGGMTQILSIILNLIASEGGVALFDEVENGIHHLVQSDVWAAIDKAAQESNTQVFATTHSLECVKAANKAYKETDTDRLRLHRLEKKDGEVRCVTYGPEEIQSLFDFNFEVR